MRGFGTTENSALPAMSRAKRVYKPKGKRAMNNLQPTHVEEVALRIDESNLDHHIWDNNGTWWIHYTIYPTPVTVERIRSSLKTKSLPEARSRRDEILGELLNQARRLAA